MSAPQSSAAARLFVGPGPDDNGRRRRWRLHLTTRAITIGPLTCSSSKAA